MQAQPKSDAGFLGRTDIKREAVAKFQYGSYQDSVELAERYVHLSHAKPG